MVVCLNLGLMRNKFLFTLELFLATLRKNSETLIVVEGGWEGYKNYSTLKKGAEGKFGGNWSGK